MTAGSSDGDEYLVLARVSNESQGSEREVREAKPSSKLSGKKW